MQLNIPTNFNSNEPFSIIGLHEENDTEKGENYIYIFDDDNKSYESLIYQLGDDAQDSKLSLNWLDALILCERAREMREEVLKQRNRKRVLEKNRKKKGKRSRDADNED